MRVGMDRSRFVPWPRGMSRRGRGEGRGGEGRGRGDGRGERKGGEESDVCVRNSTHHKAHNTEERRATYSMNVPCVLSLSSPLSPSCPCSFSPHENTRPPSVRANVCWAPAATCEEEGRRRGEEGRERERGKQGHYACMRVYV